MAKIVLDLHDIYNRGLVIDAELKRVVDEAMRKRMPSSDNPGQGIRYN